MIRLLALVLLALAGCRHYQTTAVLTYEHPDAAGGRATARLEIAQPK